MTLDDEIRKTKIFNEEIQQHIKVITYENQLKEGELYIKIQEERDDIYKKKPKDAKPKKEINIEGTHNKKEEETIITKCMTTPAGEYILCKNGRMIDRFFKSINPIGEDYTDNGD